MPDSISPTLRSSPILPPMPTEGKAAQMYRPIDMARSRLVHEDLVFDHIDDYERALQQGFFLLRNPQSMDFSAGDMFARHYFKPRAEGVLAAYTGYKDVTISGNYEGYFDREHDQWENFYIERHHWEVLPAGVADLGTDMASIGVRVLRSVLNHLGIPRHDWSLLTSGLSDSLGHQMLAFNHFRADKLVRGSKFHRDSGWVTVLRSTEPGLLAYIDGELCAINPVPNHLIINFGSSIEVLTECMKPKVRANIHGVVQTERQGIDDRVSYAMFLDSNLDGGIYRYGPSGPIWLQSVSDFAIQEVGRTYDANDGTL